ncbi:recombination protein RecR [Limibaculum sp. M0105]|uniref:Recombination protein RecR n=1 Tax=Thermohalobaculum xanthum TaxID=2753746 RepID=A0A8J7SGM2_9RHOB|nr:recombination mediator RecR [Thermohalobaculum xanthum]MBK0401026.1 recombination protein RecR [Thermohalobaculum xanthum]
MTGPGSEIERLIELMAKLPGLGPRSARRAALALVKRRERLLLPLAQAMAEVAERVALCEVCGHVATGPRCGICTDARRDATRLCVVEDVADLWALERAGVFKGRYHVLGGTLSALDGVTPESLRIPELAARVRAEGVVEVILAVGATMDGQTTAHVVADYLEGTGAEVTSLAKGVPVGGELDYLDDGTISAALSARKAF